MQSVKRQVRDEMTMQILNQVLNDARFEIWDHVRIRIKDQLWDDTTNGLSDDIS